MENNNNKKIQKKRGRKPKIIKNDANKNKEDIKKNEKIILHLNITEEDLKSDEVYRMNRMLFTISIKRMNLKKITRIILIISTK